MIFLLCVFLQDGPMRTLSVGTPTETKLSMCRPTGKPGILTCRYTHQIQELKLLLRYLLQNSGQCRNCLCNLDFVCDEVCEVHKHKKETKWCFGAKNVRKNNINPL